MISAIFCTILYLFFIFFDVILRYIPGLNYFDEIVFLLICFAAIVKFLRVPLKLKQNGLILLAPLFFLIITFIGVASNWVSDTYLGEIVVIKDFILTFKYILSLLSSLYLFSNSNNFMLKKNLITVTKFLIVVMFVCYLISLGVDIGMTGSERFGIPSYKFLYSHYTYLVFNCVVFLSILTLDSKKNYIYYFLCLVLMISTLRTKSLAFVVLFIIWKIFESKQIEFKKSYLIPAAMIGIGVMLPKVLQYFQWGWGYNLRNGLYVIGFFAMIETFPLGTGFGSFGTNLSYIYGSRVYEYYGMVGNYQGMEIANQYSVPISDVYWPSIYAQFGLFGAICFIFLLFIGFEKIRKIKCKRIMHAVLILFAYLLIASVAEASFTNDTAILSILFTILILISSQKERKWMYD